MCSLPKRAVFNKCNKTVVRNPERLISNNDELLCSLHEIVSRSKPTAGRLIKAALASKLPERFRGLLLEKTDFFRELENVGREIGGLMGLTTFESSTLAFCFALRIFRQLESDNWLTNREIQARLIKMRDRIGCILNREVHADEQQWAQWINGIANSGFKLGTLFGQTQFSPSYIRKFMSDSSETIKTYRIEDEELNVLEIPMGHKYSIGIKLE